MRLLHWLFVQAFVRRQVASGQSRICLFPLSFLSMAIMPVLWNIWRHICHTTANCIVAPSRPYHIIRWYVRSVRTTFSSILPAGRLFHCSGKKRVSAWQPVSVRLSRLRWLPPRELYPAGKHIRNIRPLPFSNRGNGCRTLVGIAWR